ncbi:MAG: hypothetical protein M1817_000779 [Caeruleum heppii]|nr:MAG: hypothetical protein M1817_000779 [Caeruleum heppii]
MLAKLRTGLWTTVDNVLGTNYSPPSPLSQSDTTSSLYPGRPIRPLPKRRIRSRLSEELAESILYPPAPSSSTPLFYFPYNYDARNGASHPSGQGVAGHGPDDRTADRLFGQRQQIEELDSEEEELIRTHRLYQGQQGYIALNDAHTAQGTTSQDYIKLGQSLGLNKPPPPRSTTSSIDGYDSFENTNNKKKRKIPTSGSSINPHSHLSADMANMGISSPTADTSPPPDEVTPGGVGQYYGSGYSAASSGTGISGAGRGRFGRNSGRTAATRIPLGVSTDGSNAWATGRSSKYRPAGPTATAGAKGVLAPSTPNGYVTNHNNDQGIISAAIASASAKGLDKAPKGQENISLLHHTASSTPTKTQFTFTSGSNVTWPGGNAFPNGHPLSAGPAGHMATQATQTHPTSRSAPGLNSSQHAPASRQQQAQRPPATGNPPGKKTRPRRSAGKEYAIAARQRRLQQEYNNYHHPPAREDIWICEFCEYESIFGAPPEALVRQYEIKDRRERRRLAEKRRLLEKAKLKGRKGKKSKNSAKNNAAANAAANQPVGHQTSAHASLDPTQLQNQDIPSDEFLEDDYDADLLPPEMDHPRVVHPPAPSPHAVKGLHVPGKAGQKANGMVEDGIE